MNHGVVVLEFQTELRENPVERVAGVGESFDALETLRPVERQTRVRVAVIGGHDEERVVALRHPSEDGADRVIEGELLADQRARVVGVRRVIDAASFDLQNEAVAVLRELRERERRHLGERRIDIVALAFVAAVRLLEDAEHRTGWIGTERLRVVFKVRTGSEHFQVRPGREHRVGEELAAASQRDIDAAFENLAGDFPLGVSRGVIRDETGWRRVRDARGRDEPGGLAVLCRLHENRNGLLAVRREVDGFVVDVDAGSPGRTRGGRIGHQRIGGTGAHHRPPDPLAFPEIDPVGLLRVPDAASDLRERERAETHAVRDHEDDVVRDPAGGAWSFFDGLARASQTGANTVAAASPAAEPSDTPRNARRSSGGMRCGTCLAGSMAIPTITLP